MAKKEAPKQDVAQEKPSRAENLAKIEESKAQIAALDTDKAHKDLLLKNSKELDEHIAKLRVEHATLANEYNERVRQLDFVTQEIKSQNLNLARQKEQFAKENEKDLAQIKNRLAEVEKADATYKTLLATVKEQEQTLRNKLNEISEKERFFESEKARLEKHVSQVEADAARTQADIALREKALADEKEAFETERKTIEPDLQRISQIKNENLSLIRKIDADREAFDVRIRSFEQREEIAAAGAESERARIRKSEADLAGREAELRKWEENLKDTQLELQALRVQLDKERKRYELNEVIKKGV